MVTTTSAVLAGEVDLRMHDTLCKISTKSVEIVLIDGFLPYDV